MGCSFLGVLITLLLVNAAAVTFIINGYTVLIQYKPVIGTLVMLIFLWNYVLMGVSYFRCMLKGPGSLPECITATHVEGAIVSELIRYGADTSSVSESVVELPVFEEDEQMNANALAAAGFTERMEGEDSAMEEPRTPMFGTGTATPFTADHPAAIEERRQRKERRGEKVLTIPELASQLLKAIRKGGEEKTRALERLLGSGSSTGIENCPLCQVYSLQRAYHCRHCDRCVLFASHHCCSLGECVGYGNHKFYFLFISYLAVCCFLSCVVSFYVTVEGWSYFVTEDDVNLPFYAAFDLALCFGIIAVPYLMKHFHTIGCGESTLMEMKRERQKVMMERRRQTRGGTFSAVLQEEEVIVRRAFDWQNVTRVFGSEFRRYRYFVPVTAHNVYDIQASSSEELKELINMRLHSLADVSFERPADTE